MFRDEMELTARSGDGGGGCVSFRREKYVPKGGADGGDGGRGGDVIVVVNPRKEDLSHLKTRRSIKADNGRQGQGGLRTGGKGADALIEVPLGTWVYEAGDRRPAAELTEARQKLLIAKGGDGGRGNARFISSVNRTPRDSEPGAEGREVGIRLEFGIPAQTAFFGHANTGKTALLAALTGCKARSDEVPFSHQRPNLALWRADESAALLVADLPSLGLEPGQGFTPKQLQRQLRRPPLRFAVVDASAPEAEAEAGFRELKSRLSFSDDELPPWTGVVLNKADESDWIEPNRMLDDWRGMCAVSASAAAPGGVQALADWILKLWADSGPGEAR